MKIIYICSGKFPTEKANGYQIAQMVQAFELNNINTTLIHYDERNQSIVNEDISLQYDLDININRKLKTTRMITEVSTS